MRIKDIPLKKPSNITDEQWERASRIYRVAKNRGDKFPELTVAQAVLETGWFKSPSGKYNYFGQKASNSQKGSVKSTKEYESDKEKSTSAKFRDYESLSQAIDDRLDKWGSKYEDADNVKDALYSIWSYDPQKGQGVGYATDVKYDEKIFSILGALGIDLDKKQKSTKSRRQKNTALDNDNATYRKDINGDFYSIDPEDTTFMEEANKETAKQDFYRQNSKKLKTQQNKKNFINSILELTNVQSVNQIQQAKKSQQAKSSKMMYGGKLKKAQDGTSGEDIEGSKKLTPGTPEYKEAYENETLAIKRGEDYSMAQPLDEVVVTADKKGNNILDNYPYYNELSEQEREYFNDPSPIGRGVRRRGRTKKPLYKDATTMFTNFIETPLQAMQTPQSLMVEGVEHLRGNEYDYSSALPGNGEYQRVPSDAWGYEDPEGFWQNTANIGMDIVADPENIVGAGIFKSLLKKGIKQGMKKGTKSLRKSTSLVDNVSKKTEAPLDLRKSTFSTDNVSLNPKLGKKIKSPIPAQPRHYTSAEANKWQKDWYNDIETKNKIRLNESIFNKALKEGKVKGENPFTQIKKRIDAEDFRGTIIDENDNIYNLTEKGEKYLKKVYGVSGYDLIESVLPKKIQNLAFSNKGRDIEDLISTLIHEGNHGVTKGNKLIPEHFKRDMVKIFGKDTKVPKYNPKKGNTHGFENDQEYLKNPTEIYARIFQLRRHFNLKPKDKLTGERVKKMIEEVSKGNTPIDWRFGRMIKNPKKLAQVMNYLPATIPAAIATKAATQNTTGSNNKKQ